MPLIPILFGLAALAAIAGLTSSTPQAARRTRRGADPAPSLDEELHADPVGTLAKYGTAADLQAQGFGDEIAGLGYRP